MAGRSDAPGGGAPGGGAPHADTADVTAPDTLDPQVAAAVDAFAAQAAGERVLLALDFDGVLAPIVARPEDARCTPASAAALRRLGAAPNLDIAMISGRALDSLCHVSSPAPTTFLVGSHGAEFRPGAAPGPGAPATPEPIQSPKLGPQQAQALAAARETLAEVRRLFPEARTETKPSGVVLHTRGMDPSAAEAATGHARRLLESIPGAHVSSGKAVLEVGVVRTDKGEAIEMLRERLRPAAVLFMGDDVTDENGFAALRGNDVGIKVGPGETRASYRVPDTVSVSAVLARLGDALGA